MNENIKSEIRALRENSAIAYIASVNEDGYPQTKAMMVLEHESMKVHYFSTNTSSKRVSQFRKNPKASVYYCDNEQFKGALFTGTIEVCTDYETRALLWDDASLKYYPKGINDEDYSVFKFTAETVNYYHGLKNTTLSIDEI
ncbi:MAG: pyridoxamine 5'-phosphate oxidase family protein [Oscillospiraceae bacterium]|nr:pyridoxamine 5'-phosphate oxidase family protein [Oscillospiraceae bacterium]